MERIMEKYDGEEYWDYLSSMSRTKLMKECVKMNKKLSQLSKICDIQDTLDLIHENTDLTKMLEARENEIRSLKEFLQEEIVNAGGRKPSLGVRPKSLVKFLIKVLKLNLQKPTI